MDLRDRIAELTQDALMTEDERTPQERAEQGKALRESVPRSAHAQWSAPADRPDPVELLKSQGKTRIQGLLPLRYERMSASAFTFYRGGALIMASDLSNTPNTGIEVQACGDAHISNFGLFNSPERHTVFDINDFDETAPGPWEWDVKRLVTSVEICGRDRGFTIEQRQEAVRSCAQMYRESMSSFADMGHLDVWYAHVNADKLVEEFSSKMSKKDRKTAEKLLGKAKAKNSSRAIARFTEVVDGQLRIVSDPPILTPLRDVAENQIRDDSFGVADIERLLRRALKEYLKTITPDKRHLIEQYHGVDAAVKVVGVGSVGTRALIVVMEGAGLEDPLVLQVKEAQESVLERFCGKSAYSNHGQRVVEGQRAIQTASDMLLGWCRIPDERGKKRDYYVRQLWDGKGSFNLEVIEPDQLTKLAEACGWTLAHAHARTGDRFIIAGYLGSNESFDKAMVKFAAAYANQNEADYARFMQALESGELDVEQD